MKPRYYKTSQGARKGPHGIEFEKNVSLLFLKRLLEINLQDFLMGRELPGVGKFDDICLVCEKDGTNKEIVLAQLKHKENENQIISYDALTEHKTGDFFLPKYLESYPEIKRSLKDDEGLKGANLKCLLICTNIGIEEDLKGIKVEQVCDDMLFKDYGLLYKLRVEGGELKKKIFPKSFKSKQERLAEEIVYYLMCNKTVDIPNMIKTEILSPLKDYHEPLSEHVIDVKTRKLKREFLSSTQHDVKMLRDCFYAVLEEFNGTHSTLNAEELKFKLNLKDSTEAQIVKQRFDQYKSCVSVEDFLNNQQFKKLSFCKTCYKTEFQQALPPNEYVDEDTVNAEIDEFLDKLIFVTGLRDVKSYTKQGISPNVYTNLTENIDHWYDDVNEKMERKWLWKEELSDKAMKMYINFQGRKVKLEQLLAGNKNFLTPDLLIRVFGSEEIQQTSDTANSLELEISVGRLLEETETINYYISRKLCRHGKNDAEESFTEEDFIHDKFQKSNRLWIVIGEPGMGKTTLLQNIAKKIIENENKSKRPTWVISVALKTYKEAIRNLDTDNVEGVIRFLAELEKCKDDFSKTLLTDYINGKGEMRIFLDGLDELDEDDQEKVIDFVDALKVKTCIDEFWLTARMHLKQKLEKRFNEISITLNELEDDDQVNLLVKFWNYKSNQKNTDKLNDFARRLLNHINMHIDSRWQKLLGIPLQASMVGLIFQKEVEKETPEIIDTLTLATLYDSFVEETYEIYFRKHDLQKLQECMKANWKQQWDRCYQYLALLHGEILYLPKDKIKSCFNIEINCSDIDALLIIGIIYEREGKIYFMHQTFAEYFVAKLFAGIMNNKHSCQNREMCINIMNSQLFPGLFRINGDNHLISYCYEGLPDIITFLSLLFDLMISKNSRLQSAILKGEYKKVEEFTDDEISDAKDSLGRTLLYYALCHDQRNILNILFHKKIKVNLNDRHLILFWYWRMRNCADAIYSFTYWTAKDFVGLASQVDFALYILENRNVIVQVDKDRFGWMKGAFSPDPFDTEGICEAAQRQIDDAKVILQEITVDYADMNSDDLSNRIAELAYKKLPLVEAHHYFESNADYFLNSEESEMREILNSSIFRKHIDVIRKSRKTAVILTYYFSHFKIVLKSPLRLVDDVRKRCNNLQHIFELIISVHIPINKEVSSEYIFEHIIIDFQDIWRKFLENTGEDNAWGIYHRLNVLKKRVDKRAITGLREEIFTNVWNAGLECSLPNLNNYNLYHAGLEVMKCIVKSSKIYHLFSMYEHLQSAIYELDKSQLCSLLQDTDQQGLLKVILDIKFENADTLEESAHQRISNIQDDSKRKLAEDILNTLNGVRRMGSVAWGEERGLRALEDGKKETVDDKAYEQPIVPQPWWKRILDIFKASS